MRAQPSDPVPALTRRHAVAACAALIVLPQWGAAPAMQAADRAPLPDLAARYRVTWRAGREAPRIQHWTFVRAAALIALHKGETEDLWRLDPNRGVRLERVYRAQQRVVDYTTGELRARGLLVDWRALGTLFDEAQLSQLTLQRARGNVAHYSGLLAGERIDLRWDTRHRLPITLERAAPSGSVHYQRLDVRAEPAADWHQPGRGADAFTRTDAADFGDMESDPFVRNVMAQEARAHWRRAHGD